MTVPADSSRRWLWAAVLVTVLKLWLTRGQEVYALGYAAHDDVLFLRLASHLLHGEWLGPYDQLTLAKGPMYSFWIAALALLHVPLYFANHLLYAAACALLVQACAPALPSLAARFAGYTLLLWNPMSYDASSLGRVLRQHLYSPEVLLIFAGLIALHYRRDLPARRLAPWAILLGLAGAAFYLTREEAVWIVPSTALLGGAALGLAGRASRSALLSLLRAFALAAGCLLLPLLLVSALNYRSYGWFGTVEFRAAEFGDAYGALTRIQVGPARPFLPVPRQAREAAYTVSPAFAELRPHLEGDLGAGWADASSGVTGRPASEHEIGGGWMTWALRDAVAAAGHAHSAGEAMAYYRRVALEVNAACDDGRLPAGPRRSGFTPQWRPGLGGELAQAFLEFTDFTTSFSRFSAFAPPSAGDEAELKLFRDLTHERLSGDPFTALDYRRVQILHGIGKTLRPLLLLLLVGAQLIATVRAVQLLANRTWSYPLTVAAAAWGGAAVYLLLTAMIQVTSYPILAISSFAPVYSLLLVFVAATAWDAGVAWLPSPAEQAPPVAPKPAAAPVIVPPPTGLLRLVPWLAGSAALLPFVIWQAEFAKLFWFADDFFLIDQLASFGFWPWVHLVFAENFVPVFKLLWGGALLQFDGSYRAMLWLMWLTHAFNTWCLGRLLVRHGLSWFATGAVLLLFALPAANIETLGWSVQWSAILAASFFLLALLWHEGNDRRTGALRRHGPVVLFAALSACCFSRGVLTGAVLAAGAVLPLLLGGDRRDLPKRLGLAGLYVLPSAAVAMVILFYSGGNHQHLAGHLGQVLQFAGGFFLLNPAMLLLDLGWTTGGLWLASLLKIAVLAAGFRLAPARLRALLWLLLAFDLGNAVLLGIGRYHTGIMTCISSRYCYSSLIAVLPFLGVIADRALEAATARRAWHHWAAAALLVVLAGACLRTWPAELAGFVGWRGTDARRQMAQPAVRGSKETMPALDFMHVERGKALTRAYHLH